MIKNLISNETNYNLHDHYTPEQVAQIEAIENQEPDGWLKNPKYAQPFFQIGDKTICQLDFHQFGIRGFREPMHVEFWRMSTDNNHIIICATACSKQRGIIIIWHTWSKTIQEIKECDYCKRALKFDSYIYALRQVPNSPDELSCEILKSKIGNDEWEKVDVIIQNGNIVGRNAEENARCKILLADSQLVDEAILMLEKATYDYGYSYASSFYSDHPDDADLVLRNQEDDDDLGILDIYDATGEIIGSYQYLELLQDLEEDVFSDELGYWELRQLLKEMNASVLEERFMDGEIGALKDKFGADGFEKLYP